MSECRNSHKPGREMEKQLRVTQEKRELSPGLSQTPSFLLTFSSTRISYLSCFYLSAGDHDLVIKTHPHKHLSTLSQRLGWSLDALIQQLVQAQHFLANVVPCCSVCRHASINGNKTMYLTNTTGIELWHPGTRAEITALLETNPLHRLNHYDF